MKRIVKSLKILWRAESLLGTLRLAVAIRKTSVLAFAGLVGVFGVAMLDVSAFFALTPRLGQAGAALAVGLADIAMAFAGVLVAQSMKPGAELDMVIEMRDMALADLEAEAAALEQSVVHARRELVDLVRHPFTSLAPDLILPTIRSALASLRSSRSRE